MTAYRRGADFERRAMKRLEEMGAVFVTRSAGSHTPVDIIAFGVRGDDFIPRAARAYPPWFIQAKSGRTKISRKDRMELVDLAHDCGAVPVLVTRGMKFEVLEGNLGS
jgi:Holliday junction resolvase